MRDDRNKADFMSDAARCSAAKHEQRDAGEPDRSADALPEMTVSLCGRTVSLEFDSDEAATDAFYRMKFLGVKIAAKVPDDF